MTCLAVGALTLALSAPEFTLHWTHSVEKTEWVEHWQVAPPGLRLLTARIKGSGAGMEPGEGAVLVDGWWQWHPGTAVPALHLAASGATGDGWRLCDGAHCHVLGAMPGDAITVAPCPP